MQEGEDEREEEDDKDGEVKCPMCDYIGADWQRMRTHFKIHDTDGKQKSNERIREMMNLNHADR